LREALAAYRDSEDLIQLGAYVAGSNPALDAGIRFRPDILAFLRQDHSHNAELKDTLTQLDGLAARLRTGSDAKAPALTSA
jgi:flagellum-specific ATP synthase/type III secretion protein N (ATPase)